MDKYKVVIGKSITNVTRKKAAVKGWATRKANLISARQRAAAKKAWKTRKQND